MRLTMLAGTAVLALSICGAPAWAAHPAPRQFATTQTQALGEYVVLGWNDLGMAFLDPDFSALCFFPPQNNLNAEVIHRGPTPQLVTAGVQLEYRFPDHATAAGKTNFWTYAPALFGIPVPADTGLGGAGLTGQLTLQDGVFMTTGIPLTPYEDTTLTTQPYQFAEVTLRPAGGGAPLDTTVFVAPVSNELGCDAAGCHGGGGQSAWDAILASHDANHGTDLANSKPVLCAQCHADVFVGRSGEPGTPALSLAIHRNHGNLDPNQACETCHPGQRDPFQRDAMSIQQYVCEDCHGTLTQVWQSIENDGRRPWLDEPRCDAVGCHDANHGENPNTLFRNSTDHGGLRCATCHNSPHANLPTLEPRDGVQMLRVQGRPTHLTNCFVCHTTEPTGPGPHGIITAWHILQHIMGRIPMDPGEAATADYNFDGVIDIGDVVFQIERGL